MRSLPAALVTGFAMLVMAGTAHAAPSFGVADDAGKYAEDGGAGFFRGMNSVGLTTNRITVQFDPARPNVIVEKGFLDRSMPHARLRNINVVFSLYPTKADALTASFLPVLAATYDALKAVNPAIRVHGVGLSERGNDDPKAASNVSTSPIRFLRDLGAAYRASGRTKPIMDELVMHPYPEVQSDEATKSYAWPSAGFGNLDRVKQAVWDAFNGTAQPTTENGLKLKLGEIG